MKGFWFVSFVSFLTLVSIAISMKVQVGVSDGTDLSVPDSLQAENEFYDRMVRRNLQMIRKYVKERNLTAPTVNISRTYVTARDGVRLYSQIWLPEVAKTKKVGTILARSPYGMLVSEMWVPYILEGYALLQQDIRGMHKSEGNHVIYYMWRYCGIDGFDTIQWITQQPWSNGDVFDAGLSADGIAAYAQGLESPPNLKGQLLTYATADAFSTIYPGGAFREALMTGWLTFILRPATVPVIWEHESPTDPWYYNISLPGKESHIKWPAVHYAGWYDIFLQGNIDAFNGYDEKADPVARGKSFLVIDPLGHCELDGPLNPEHFPNNLISLPIDLSLEVFRHASMGTPIPSNRKKINFYVMGPIGAPVQKAGNYWTALDAFPTPNYTNFYLNNKGLLSLDAPETSNTHASYIYDPENPLKTNGGNNLLILCGPRNQIAEENRSDVVIFTTKPLSKDTVVTGRMTAKLSVSSNATDTDFIVKITDVYPDGNHSMLIQDGIVRMKWRDLQSKASPVVPGNVYQVSIDLWSTSYVFNKGHSIRVAVSSSNHPRFNVNPNTFVPVSEYSITKKRLAENTVYFSKEHPSYVILPIVDIASLPPTNF